MYLLTKEQIIPTLLLLLSRHSTLFLLLVVSSNASDWGCLTLVRETWGREIQNGRRRRKTFSPSSGAGRVNFPSQTTEKVPFLFSLLFSFQLVWRHVVVGSSSSSGGVSFSLGLLFTLGPCWRKKKGKGSRASWFSYLTLVKQTRAGLPTFLLFFPSGGAGYSLHNADAAASLFAAVWNFLFLFSKLSTEEAARVCTLHV